MSTRRRRRLTVVTVESNQSTPTEKVKKPKAEKPVKKKP
jgi:hypothetical protein